MSKQVIEDARAAYNAWREASQGSYVERVLADGIVRDIVPALIHAAERKPLPIGFSEEEIVNLDNDTEVTDD